MINLENGISPYWFIGEVVDKNDPINSGRVKVRVFGIHPPDPNNETNDKHDLDNVADQDLPWAFCIQGAYGKIQCIPEEGEWVFGFFADGRECQHPFLLGTLIGSNTDADNVSPSITGSTPAQESSPSATQNSDVTSPTATQPVTSGDIVTTDSDITGVLVSGGGQGYNVVQLSDGTTVRRQGSRAWRNNNPGNIEYGDYAKTMGAIGSDGRFAIFPNYETGRRAKERLLFETSSYRNLTLDQAINRYAPSFENNTSAYIQNVSQSAGIDPNTRMIDIPQSARQEILNAFEQQEGFRAGTETIYNAGS